MPLVDREIGPLDVCIFLVATAVSGLFVASQAPEQPAPWIIIRTPLENVALAATIALAISGPFILGIRFRLHSNNPALSIGEVLWLLEAAALGGLWVTGVFRSSFWFSEAVEAFLGLGLAAIGVIGGARFAVAVVRRKTAPARWTDQIGALSCALTMAWFVLDLLIHPT